MKKMVKMLIYVVTMLLIASLIAGCSLGGSTEKEGTIIKEEDNTQKSISKASGKGGEEGIEKNVITTSAKIGDGILVNIKNNNEVSVDVEIQVEFYDADNKFLGAREDYVSALVANTESIVSIDYLPENYSSYKIFADVDESFDISYVDKITLTHNDTGKEITAQAKNDTENVIDAIGAYAIYYSGDEIVGYDDEYETDIAPGRTANFEFFYPEDENYDEIPFDSYKIIISEAMSFADFE